MIGNVVTTKDGVPVDGNGTKLAASSYQPNSEIGQLYARVQNDYQVAWAMQHRNFDEFDGVSMLERARLDQQTFGAFVGAEFVPEHKKWRFRGRKNTARNKIIGILAHMIAGMLYPFVYAKKENDEEDKLTARVMRILIESYLKKADYEINFLFIVLSALVNPAVFVGVEFVEAMQRIKVKMADGTYKVKEVVDELMSGLKLHNIPVDEILLGDFFTGPIQAQPYIIRVRRISYDTARSIHSGKYFDADGKDMFGYVDAGMTRVWMAGQENSTLYSVEWTEADRNFVQELTVQYRGEDLELTWVGGIPMFNQKEPYNSNPMKHRRLALLNDTWYSIPVYPYAMSGFEPLDPNRRFAYFKSAAFKEYWDDQTLNIMNRLAVDGSYLDVIKPMLLSGVSKIDSSVMVPGSTIAMPTGATATPYALGPNLAATYNAMVKAEAGMSESTQDPIMNGQAKTGVTAYATQQAEQNARKMLGVFGIMIADLVKQIGELTRDCVIWNATTGDLDTSVPGTLNMKFKTQLIKGKEKGKDVTNKIVFTSENMGKKMTKEQIDAYEWALYNRTGKTPEERLNSSQRIYTVNPYKFARTTYTLYVDPDKIVMKSMGADEQRSQLAFSMLMNPLVQPYVDVKNVVDDFVIEKYGGDDPDRYKKKDTGVNPMMDMAGAGAAPPAGQNKGGVVVPPKQNIMQPTQ